MNKNNQLTEYQIKVLNRIFDNAMPIAKEHILHKYDVKSIKDLPSRDYDYIIKEIIEITYPGRL